MVAKIAICVLSFAIYVGVGMWARRQQRTMGDFVIAGGRLGIWPVAFSLTASIMSGYACIGAPGFAYSYGYGPWIGVGIIGGVLGILLAYLVLARPMVILAEKHGAMTIPDMLSFLYGGSAIRWVAAISILLACFSYMLAQWPASAYVMQDLVGVSYGWGLVISVAVLASYVILGGMTATIVNDLFQQTFTMIGAVACAVVAIKAAGGFTAMNQTLASVDPGLVKGWLDKGFTGWTLFSFFIIFGLGSLGQPHTVSKFYSLRRAGLLKWGCLLSIITYSIGMLFYFNGLSARALVAKGAIQPLANPDLATPTIISLFMSPAMAGVVWAGAMAAIMSTVSSFAIVSSAALLRDIADKCCNVKLTDRQALMWSRVITLVLILVSVLMSLRPIQVVGWMATNAWSMFAAAFTPALVLGVLWKGATREGAVASVATGIALSFGLFVLKVTKVLPPPKLDIGAISIIAAFLVLVGVSLFTKTKVQVIETKEAALAGK